MADCRETVCIDCNRIMDSCRDKDCYEDARVYLTDFGQELICQSNAVRTKCANVIGSNLTVSPLTFNRGFYQVNVRMYVRCVCEACIGCGRPQEFDGLVILDKNVILYGSEGSVKIFKSDPNGSDFCNCPQLGNCETNLPTAVLEVVDPVVLSTKVQEPCGCQPVCCCPCDLPEPVSSAFRGTFTENRDIGRILTVSLGFFSVVRIERPGQYLINGTEYAVPEKECAAVDEDDPCSAFRKMPFPSEQFAPPALKTTTNSTCGCFNH